MSDWTEQDRTELRNSSIAGKMLDHLWDTLPEVDCGEQYASQRLYEKEGMLKILRKIMELSEPSADLEGIYARHADMSRD